MSQNRIGVRRTLVVPHRALSGATRFVVFMVGGGMQRNTFYIHQHVGSTQSKPCIDNGTSSTRNAATKVPTMRV